MFTGLVESVGQVGHIGFERGATQFAVDLGPLASEVRAGDSVAISGVCLTAETLEGGTVVFKVVPETLSRTTLARLGPGSPVNVELAVRVGDRLGGHLVQGHVDGVGTVETFDPGAAERRLVVRVSPDLGRQMIPKGSVAVDGVSLTIAACGEDRFTVALIPLTFAKTTLGGLRPGDAVNIEVDPIGKYVRQALRQILPSARLSIEKLREHGFLDP